MDSTMVLIFVILMTLCGSALTACPETCLLDNLVTLSKCSKNNWKQLESDGEVCKGCYQCSTDLRYSESRAMNILPFLQSKSHDHEEKRLFGNFLGKIQNGLKDGLQTAFQNGMKSAFQNGIKNGAKGGFQNSIKDALKNGVKNGLKNVFQNGAKNGAKNSGKSGFKNSLENVFQNGLKNGLKGVFQDGGKSFLKHAVFKRDRRAIRDPGASNQLPGNGDQRDPACKRLMHKLNNTDDETIRDVMLNCPTLDCVETFHHDTCVLDTEVCFWANNRLCPDCPKCRDNPAKSRGKKSVKSLNDLNSSIKLASVKISDGWK